MNTDLRKSHWEKVFQNNDTTKVSWYQPVPKTSLNLIQQLPIKKTARIIDIGAGDSFLADHLLKLHYSDISLLDISEKALKTVKNRLGESSGKVSFFEKDVLQFETNQKFDVWHDRAVFHFFNQNEDIENYVQTVSKKINQNGYLIIGTFSENGPEKCSGLNVKRYTEKELSGTFQKYFNKIECFKENHTTPSGSVQNFLFCVFQKK